MKLHCLLLLSILTALPAYGDLLIIGHPDLVSTSIEPNELADIFLKRHASLAGEHGILPVNRLANSSARTLFENLVLHLSEREIKQYWLKLRFKGIRPPIVQESDEASILFIKKVPGAITYIESYTVPEGTKLLLRIEN